MSESEQTPWYEAYERLAAALYEFYLEHKEKTGRELYKKCMAEENKWFQDENNWMVNYGKTFKGKEYKVLSVDPIQIYASFNGNNTKPKNLQKRLNEFLEIMGQPTIKAEIDYNGCPRPNPVQLMNSRKEKDHEKIWELFGEAFPMGRDKEKYPEQIDQLSPELFHGFREWYGLQITSLTIFLFWINSRNLLSLDGNTINLLETAEKITGRPQDLNGYRALLTEKDTSLYRNLVALAVEQLDVPSLKPDERSDLEKYLNENHNFKQENQTVINKNAEQDAKTTGDGGKLEKPKATPRTLEEIAEAKKSTRLQLLAIRPLEMGADNDLLKSLQAETFYHFRHSYRFSAEGDEVKVIYDEAKDLNIYDKIPEEKEHPENGAESSHEPKTQNTEEARDEDSQDTNPTYISISAIVGKNGAGKSTLVELLLMAINNIAHEYFPSKDDQDKTHNVKLIKDLCVELYFKRIQNKVLCIRIRKNQPIKVITIRINDKGLSSGHTDTPEELIKELFYSIVTNYSLHGLRSNERLNPWLHKLFHKNDAYQIPVVLTPMRDDGTITVSRLFGQVKTRMVSNLLLDLGLESASADATEEEKAKIEKENDAKIWDSYRRLSDTQIAELIHFKLNPEKIKKEVFHFGIKVLLEDIKQKPAYILQAVQEKFPTEGPRILDEKTTVVLGKYLQQKLVTICLRYPPYTDFFDLKNREFTDLTGLLKKIAGDPSHIGYKLKRAINFIRYGLYPAEIANFDRPIRALSESISVLINEKGNDKENPLSIDTLIPPSFFIPVIYMKAKKAPGGDPHVSFDRLSSGEKQRAYAIHSLIYHLRNLDSVQEDQEKGVHTYQTVNVIFDEVELYFHPEWQRTYIAYMLRMIRKFEYQNIRSINICFVTHSPFILSDIPDTNILFLDKENSKDGKTIQTAAPIQTFAANIHEMLVNGFFMDHTVGEFALKKIKEIVDFYEKVMPIKKDDLKTKAEEFRKKLNDYKKITQLIGEDYLRGILENHLEALEKKLAPDTFRLAKIKRLEDELKRERALMEGRQR